MSAAAKIAAAIRENLCALFDVERVRIARFPARAFFNHELKSDFKQIWDYRGHQSNPALSGITFFGYTDNHRVISSRTDHDGNRSL